jgi:hypothetical protein
MVSDLNQDEVCLGCGAPIDDEYPIDGETYDCPECGQRHFFVWDTDSGGLIVEKC